MACDANSAAEVEGVGSSRMEVGGLPADATEELRQAYRQIPGFSSLSPASGTGSVMTFSVKVPEGEALAKAQAALKQTLDEMRGLEKLAAAGELEQILRMEQAALERAQAALKQTLDEMLERVSVDRLKRENK